MLLASCLAIAALAAFSIALPYNLDPLVVLALAAWAVLIAAAHAIPGASRWRRPAMLILITPDLPVARAAAAIWPRLRSPARGSGAGRADGDGSGRDDESGAF